VRALKVDFRTAGLDEPTVALLEYAEKLTVAPYKIVDEDVTRLKNLGWDEEQIVQATHVVGVFNYLVRLADAFGIEWEAEVEASPTHQPELWDGKAGK
jgi:alkylhydroperoxidase family enzyme